MQFNSNSDFPGQNLPKEQWPIVARPPIPFDEPKFIPCACITTRILVNINNALAAGLESDVLADGLQQHVVVLQGMNYLVQTARGVLVKTPNPALMQQGQGWVDWSDSSDFSVESGKQDEDAATLPQAAVGISEGQPVERAYWLRRTLRSAIYGKVRFGIVLHKLSPPVQILLPGASSPTDVVNVEWEAITELVAVKEMSWDQIQTQGHRLAEDPVKEIAAMQHLERWLENENMHQQQEMLQQQNLININAQLNAMNLAHPIAQSGLPFMNSATNQYQYIQGSAYTLSPPSQRLRPRNHVEAHVMITLDSLTDGRNLYCVMPYCSGGELFDVLEKRNKFPESEARYWFHQILEGLTTLKAAGVCHRDLSLENLMIHGNNALIIDMGMCLRVPMVDSSTNQRFLITPQGTCGKWHCMSPEICSNSTPFDGHAVDLWAAGVILFIMLTGYPPWEKPTVSDERFKFMSNGYLVHMLTEWKTGLSADAMDLLQRMFWLDPTDRLSLEQVWAHPWTQKAD